MFKKVALFLIGIGISVAACWWVLRHTNLDEVGAELRKLGWPAALGIAGLYCIGFFPRTYRSVAMAKGFAVMKPVTALEAIVLGYASNNLLPLRMGEIVRTLFVAHELKCSRTASLTLVAAERILDALCLALVLLVSLALLSLNDTHLPPDFAKVLGPAVIAVFTGFAAVVCVAFFGPQLGRLVDRFGNEKVSALYRRVLEATQFTRDRGTLLKVSILSFAVWACEGTVFCATCALLDVPHPLLAGFLTLAFVNLGVLIPSSPGYVGVFHAAAIFALTPLGVGGAVALTVAIICHAVPFFTVCLAGLVVFIRHYRAILGLRRESLTPPSGQ